MTWFTLNVFKAAFSLFPSSQPGKTLEKEYTPSPWYSPLLHWFAWLVTPDIRSFSSPWLSITSDTWLYCDHHLTLSRQPLTLVQWEWNSDITPAQCQKSPSCDLTTSLSPGPQSGNKWTLALVSSSAQESHIPITYSCVLPFHSFDYKLLERISYHEAWHLVIIPFMFFQRNFWNGEIPSMYIRRPVWIHSLKISRYKSGDSIISNQIIQGCSLDWDHSEHLPDCLILVFSTDGDSCVLAIPQLF